MATHFLPHHLFCCLCCLLLSTWSSYPVPRAQWCVQGKDHSLSCQDFKPHSKLTLQFDFLLPTLTSTNLPWPLPSLLLLFPVVTISCLGFTLAVSPVILFSLPIKAPLPSPSRSSPTSTKHVNSPWEELFHFLSILFNHVSSCAWHTVAAKWIFAK